MSLFPKFMKSLVAAAFTLHLSVKPKSWHYSVKEGALTTYYQVVIHLSETYATDNVIIEKDSEITRYVKPTTMLPLEFGNALWLKTLRCPQVYNKHVLRGMFLEEQRQSDLQFMQSNCSSHGTELVQKLAYHSTSGKQLQAAAHPLEQPQVYTKHLAQIKWSSIQSLSRED